MTPIINNCNGVNRYEKEKLAQELWIEIFIRSSVKSLQSVKCVCKSWHALLSNLVSNPSFINKHLKFQKTMSKKNGCFFLHHYDYFRKTSNYLLFDNDYISTPSTSNSNVIYSVSYKEHRVRLVSMEGPVNGLYCVHNGRDRFVIWNPATKEVGILPDPEESLPRADPTINPNDDPGFVRYISMSVTAFGTDPLNEEDYKVIFICNYEKGDGVDDYCQMLYTTNTNTWRLLENVGFVGAEYPSSYSSNNTYLNGFYYWITCDYDLYIVLAFDMNKEVFQTIQPPIILSEGNGCYGYLALQDDHIVLFTMHANLCECDTWVLMVEEGIWIKKISAVSGIPGEPLGFWKKDDELLVIISGHEFQNCQIALYNTTTRDITNVGPKGLQSQVYVYYESLVSLSGGITKYKGNNASSLDKVYTSWLQRNTKEIILLP